MWVVTPERRDEKAAGVEGSVEFGSGVEAVVVASFEVAEQVVFEVTSNGCDGFDEHDEKETYE
jgi:hypothetical protein